MKISRMTFGPTYRNSILIQQNMNFAGLKNGKLLEAVESAGFAVLVTGDRTLH